MKENKSPKRRWLGALAATWPAPNLVRFLNRQECLVQSDLSYDNRVDFVGSMRLAAELACYCDLRFLAPESDMGIRPGDMLLIEGCWLRKTERWRDYLLGTSEGAKNALMQLVARYRERGTRVVLWLTDERNTYPALKHLFPLVDAIYTAEPDGAETDSEFEVLLPGVHVKAFNPYKSDEKSQVALADNARILVDGADDLMRSRSPAKSDAELAALWRYTCWLIDSSSRIRGVDRKLGAIARRRFLGCLDAPGFAYVLRAAAAVFYPREVVRDRPAYFHRRFLQAAATKTLLLTDAPAGLHPLFQHGFFDLDGSALEDLLGRLHQDKVYQAVLQHMGWREVTNHHTLFERVAKLLGDAGVALRMQGSLQPRVNVVVPTIRPELLPFVLTYYSRFNYPHKRLSIVLNGVKLPRKVERMAAQMDDVKICSVPADKSIGYCINYGIDQWDCDYWAKADDDDLYGPNYLLDHMLQRKYLDFDVSGKGAIFNYIEASDSMHIRKLNRIDAPGDFVAGGALVVRNDSRYFPEDVRGYADTLFLLERMEAGDSIVASDPFNFLQIRRADPLSHTWSAGPNLLNLTGPARKGLDLSAVIV